MEMMDATLNARYKEDTHAQAAHPYVRRLSLIQEMDLEMVMVTKILQTQYRHKMIMTNQTQQTIPLEDEIRKDSPGDLTLMETLIIHLII
jgi:hypothetical protein